MNSSPIASKFANSGVVMGWVGFILSHLDDVNKFLQFIALICAIAASVAAYRFHTRNTPKQE